MSFGSEAHGVVSFCDFDTELCLGALRCHGVVSFLFFCTELCLSPGHNSVLLAAKSTELCLVQEHGVVSHDFGGGSSLSV